MSFLPRHSVRLALHTLFACAAALCLPQAQAQGTQPIKLVVPVPAGGSLDALARKVALSFTAVSGQAIIVENRPGASGQIGIEQVAKSAPDGKTLLVGSSFLSTNPLQFKGALNPQTELKPVVRLADNEIYLVVNPSLQLEKPEDLRELARQRPGGLNCAAVPGQMALGCERLKILLDGKLTSIPYPGVAPALTAVAAGHVDLIFTTYGSLKALVESRRVQPLAVVAEKHGKPPYERLPVLKDTWPGFVMGGYAGIFVPAGTPPAVIAALNSEFNRALATPELTQALQEIGYTKRGGSPEVLARTLASDATFYNRIAADTGLVPQ